MGAPPAALARNTEESCMKVKQWLKRAYRRYIIDALSAMGMGLFASLIIGLILSQLAQISFLTFLAPYCEVLSASSPVVGAAIGVAIGYGLKVKPLAVFSCAAAGRVRLSDERPRGRVPRGGDRRGAGRAGRW